MTISFILIIFSSYCQFPCHFSSDMAQVEGPICFKIRMLKPTSVYVSHRSRKLSELEQPAGLVFTVAVEAPRGHADVVIEMRVGLNGHRTP